MTSQLSFGNYGLLGRIVAGEKIRPPAYFPSILEPSFAVTGRDGFLVITAAGMAELRKERAPFPKLGMLDFTECPRCGFEALMSLCVGECR